MNNEIPVLLSFSYFRIPLQTPIVIGANNNTLTVREGLRIELTDKSDPKHIIKTFGECAPLPGFHEETLDDCVDMIMESFAEDQTLYLDPAQFDPHAFLFDLLIEDINISEEDFEQDGDEDFDKEYNEDLDEDLDEDENEDEDDGSWYPSLPPSLQFALEQALLSWYQQKTGRPSPAITNGTSAEEVKNHTLLFLNEKTINEIPAKASSIKLKMGRTNNIAGELPLLQELHRARPDLTWRLDPNRLFSPQEWKILSDFLAHPDQKNFKLDYIEDVYSPHYPHIPLALDHELLQYIDNEGNLRVQDLPPQTKALVLKPTMLSLSLTQKLITDNHHRFRIILSSTYDSEGTLATLRELALQLAPAEYHGLDTGKFLSLKQAQFKIMNLHETK